MEIVPVERVSFWRTMAEFMGKAPTPKPKKNVRAPAQPVRLHDAAARSRANQRRRQNFSRSLRHFESLLPDASIARRIARPHVDFVPLFRFVRSRILWVIVFFAAVLASLVTWAHTDDRWFIYREDVQFNGLSYLDADELWQASQLEGWQVFWIDANEVRRLLLQNPYVADVQVHISQLGAKVTADVTEVRPVMLWTTDSGTYWLRDDGLVLEPRGETPPGLSSIIDVTAAATLPGAVAGSAIDPEVLRSAQALVNRLPGITTLRYNEMVGLNFQLPDVGYWVYWGHDAGVEKKLNNLAAAETLLRSRRAEGAVIDVRFDRPYIK